MGAGRSEISLRGQPQDGLWCGYWGLGNSTWRVETAKCFDGGVWLNTKAATRAGANARLRDVCGNTVQRDLRANLLVNCGFLISQSEREIFHNGRYVQRHIRDVDFISRNGLG